ncbi:MAG: NADH-quinone oxidoreductase subunit J [Dehalococcoidia bacterium]|nr:NADH-quinone oxidoreductase subunit J [Dehalococcoidia bacterium]
MDSPGVVAAFWVLSALTVGSALAVFLSRNLIHAVVFLVASFLGMAGLFITLSADFIAVAQMLIYAGAVSILMVFAVMLTPLAARDNANSLFVLPGVALGAAFAAVVGYTAVNVDWPQVAGEALDARSFADTVRGIGDALLGPYLLAFEMASVLLLAALLGAIVLVREDRS